MDYLPELTHNGQNWTAYGSSVLCAINDEGLMGFLVGSERRPIHPAQLEGRGEGWTPQTDDERDEVAVWRTADRSWTQRNATVNYTIVCGIPDTIFSSMLHLKSPLEKWYYLESRFGRIPRPESWLVVEEAMRQGNLLPKQDAAEETAHPHGDSDDEPANLPERSSEALEPQEDPPESPDDCAETKSGYLTPETEVVGTQHVELHLPVVEVGSMDWERPDEHANAFKAPEEGGQCTSTKVEESWDLPEPSSKALELECDATRPAGSHSIESGTLPSFEEDQSTLMNGDEPMLNIPDPPGTHAKLPNPQVEPPTLRSECEVTGSTLGDPNEESEGSSQLRETERPEPHRDRMSEGKFRIFKGRFTWDAPPDEAWGMGVLSSPRVGWGDGMAVKATATRLEIRNISAQTTQALPNLPHPEMHPKEPDKGKISNGYKDTVSRDITTLCSVQRALLIDRGCQHSKREMKQPDDLPVLHRLPSNGITDTPRMSRVSHQHSRINTKPVSVSGPQTRGYRHLIPNIPISLPCEVSRHLWNIADTFRRQDTPSRRTRSTNKASTVKMAVSQQWHETTRWDSEHMWLEHHDTASKDFVDSHVVEKIPLAISRSQQGERDAKWRSSSPAPPPTSTYYGHKSSKGLRRRARLKSNAKNESQQAKRSMAVQNQPTWGNLPSSGRTAVGSMVMQLGVDTPTHSESEKALLTDSGSQHSERKAKRARSSPAPPAPSPNGILDMPTPFTDLCRPGRVKTSAESVSKAWTRQNAYLTLIWPLPPLSIPSKRLRHSTRGSWRMKRGYSKIRRARRVETRGHTYRIARILMRLVQPLFAPVKHLRYPVAGTWMVRVNCNMIRSTRKPETRGRTHRIAGILMPVLQLLSNPSKRLWNVASTYWRQGVPPGSMQSDAKRPRNLRMAKRLPVSRGMRRDNEHRAEMPNDLPARLKPPRNDLEHAPSTFPDPRRHGRLKAKAENVSNMHMRQNACRARVVLVRPLTPLLAPANRALDPSGGLWTKKIGCREVRHARRDETRGGTYRTAHVLMRLFLPFSTPSKWLRYPTGGLRMVNIRCNEVSSARIVQTRAYPYLDKHTQACVAIRPSRAPKKRLKPPWGVLKPYRRQGVPPEHTRSVDKPSLFEMAASQQRHKSRGQRTASILPKWKLRQRGASNTTKHHPYSHGLEALLAEACTLVY
ncbi:hypothetical protein EDD15DRAFT_2371206 [Pisolithus albus]|nr:hypothetical protein EDD15DRAFT_2371206 [Pisolithus albus]